MSLAILGLTSGFILTLVFLLYLLLRTELNIGLKFLAVFIVSGFYIIQYESLQQYTGWPSTDDLPEQFILVATDVLEPNQKTGEQGVMYWWVRDRDRQNQPPRIYQLPYEFEVHKKTEQVVEEQKKGSQYIGQKALNSASSMRTGFKFEKISKAERLKKNIRMKKSVQ